jgi:hypothetical protein
MNRRGMNRRGAGGATLVVGLILLSLVTLLGLAGASTAHVEQQLAQNEQFRENAASAASAGIEIAISRIVTTATPAAVPASLRDVVPGTTDRFETTTRFVGFEPALPQVAGELLAGAHFEISSTGYSARRAVDRQRADVMLVVSSPDGIPLPCEPEISRHCYVAGELARLSWQRVVPD